ncbi:MAG: XdhC family protein [Steroidobacteraceae bacterium]
MAWPIVAIIESVESLLGPLLPLFDRERAAGNAVTACLLVETAGSTYRKPGALMLIAANGDYAGLLSGGCLEGDLREHARSVIDTGEPRLITYDMRGGEDLMWGLGLGCEGAMKVLLFRAGPDTGWQPLSHLKHCLLEQRPTSVGIVVESQRQDMPAGTTVLPAQATYEPMDRALPQSAAGLLRPPPVVTTREPAVAAALEEAAQTGRASWFESAAPHWKLFALPLTLPPRLLLLGAGPDAVPVVDFAVRLNWRVTLFDHRAAYADPAHFPTAERVALARPADLLNEVDATHVSAAVVMSHHLPTDLEYLRVLARTRIPYIGLLGPALRRDRLLADLGSDADTLRARLHAPVGLALGGRSPESIALAIVAQVHAFLEGTDASSRHPNAAGTART